MAGRRKRKRRQMRAHRINQPGISPGTLILDPAWKPPAMHALTYSPGKAHEIPAVQVADLAEIINEHAVTWINIEGLGDEKILLGLRELFGLHPLALEDVVNLHQRPKIEKYGPQTFLVLHLPFFEERLNSEQISLFWGARFVLTFQEGVPGDPFGRVRERIRGGIGKIRSQGPDYLVYALIDAVVDAYFPIIESIGDRIETLEEMAFLGEGFSLETLHHLKRDLQTMRRGLWPLNDMLTAMTRDTGTEIREETRVHLRDCHDHTLRLIELTETYRETCADLMNLHLTMLSNKTNEIMKVLTIIATIFIPLSFFAGVWGMNFEYMPELKSKWGYPAALAMMGSVAWGLYFFFRRRGWVAPPPWRRWLRLERGGKNGADLGDGI